MFRYKCGLFISVALEWLPKVISAIERGHALRVADPRSGARLCEAQDSRRPNDPEICFSNHSGLSFTKSGFLSQSLLTSAATRLYYFSTTARVLRGSFRR